MEISEVPQPLQWELITWAFCKKLACNKAPSRFGTLCVQATSLADQTRLDLCMPSIVFRLGVLQPVRPQALKDRLHGP